MYMPELWLLCFSQIGLCFFFPYNKHLSFCSTITSMWLLSWCLSHPIAIRRLRWVNVVSRHIPGFPEKSQVYFFIGQNCVTWLPPVLRNSKVASVFTGYTATPNKISTLKARRRGKCTVKKQLIVAATVGFDDCWSRANRVIHESIHLAIECGDIIILDVNNWAALYF